MQTITRTGVVVMDPLDPCDPQHPERSEHLKILHSSSLDEDGQLAKFWRESGYRFVGTAKIEITPAAQTM